MSILIKGMAMPRHCGECGIEWCNRWKRLIIAGMPIAQERPQDCPLVEIPPHGDLIERDALAKKLGITDMDCSKCDWNNRGFCNRGLNFVDACDAIENAPTIIPAEESDT